jgi:selenocysteine-specific elongation factor
MRDAPLTLGTAGHIDHGKTALIEALTGVNTDRLPQERERGISIELGFARLALPSGRELGIVDVPGHERFVRTMVAGATGIDLFLLVVAADDGPMPQTREHLAVLELLGVGAGVVALTKVDAVGDDQRALAAAQVEEMLASTPYAGMAPVPVSARQGTGLGDLRGALEQAAAALAPRPSREGPARMHVDRCFTLRGIGTVVTGTLWAGGITEGQEVRIEPGSRHARVRAVHVHDEQVPAAPAGRRVALNLAGIERSEIQRGDVVLAPESDLAPAHFVDAAARLLPGARPLRAGTRVHVHHGTRDTPARIVPLESERFDPGAEQFVQLRLERPLVPAPGDRFVLRQVAPPDTLGGGSIVDPRARKHGPGAAHVARLRAIESDDPLAALRLELEAAQSGVGPEAGEELLAQLAEAGAAVRAGGVRPRWFAPQALERSRSEVLRAVTAAEPGRGVGAGALSRITNLEADAVAALLDDLLATGAVTERAGVFTAAGAPRALNDPVALQLAELVRADGVAPRAPDALANAAGVDRAAAVRSLDRLAAEGVLVRLRPGVYFDPGALADARAAVESACARDGSITIAALRDSLGTSRKHAQAILEYLDQTRVTRRRGDEHVLRARGI